MNLSINPINKQPQFGSKRINPTLSKELKYIPDIPCACCGKKVIMPESITKAFRVVTKPLSKMIENGYFNQVKKYPELWKVIEQFAKSYPEKSLDKILEDATDYNILRGTVNYTILEDKTIPENERNIKSGKLYQDLLNRSRSELRGSGAVMKRFASLKPFLTDVKLQTFEQLQIYAKKYPRKTLSEIISIDEIYKYHNVKDLLQRAQTKEIRDFHYQNIIDFVKSKKVSPEVLEHFNDLKEKSIDIMATERDTKARVFMIKALYENSLKEYGLENLKQKVFDEIDKLPTTFITTDSFLVFAKNHNFSDLEIIYSLINPFMSSFEHILPQSKGGKDDIYNGIVLCRKCNLNRADISYSDFVKYHPEMKYNLQKQIDYISKFILNGQLDSDYKYWPIKVSRHIYNYTDGEINPDVSNYCKKLVRKTQAKMDTRVNLMAQLNEERENKLKQKEELLKQIQDLDSSVTELEVGVDNLKHDNNVEYNLVKSCESYILRGNESGRKNRKQ